MATETSRSSQGNGCSTLKSTAMDKFMFIPESGSAKPNSQAARELIRANAMRHSWQHAQGSRKGDSKGKGKGKKQEGHSSKDRQPFESAEFGESISSVDPDNTPSNDSSNYDSNDCSNDSVSPPAASYEQPEDYESILTDSNQPLYDISETFSRLGLSTDHRSYQFFHHFSQEFHAVCCDAVQPVLPSTKYNIYRSTATQSDCFALFHAMCYMGAVHEALLNAPLSTLHETFKSSNAPTDAVREALNHKSESLQKLKASFTRPNPTQSRIDATILCVCLHMYAEASIGEDDNITVHKKGLLNIIEQLGGIENLSPQMRLQVYLAELKAATAQLRPHSFSLPSRWSGRKLEDRSSWPIEDTAKSNATSLVEQGSGFATDFLATNVNSDLRNCIAYTKHLCEIRGPVGNDDTSCTLGDYIFLDYTLLSFVNEASFTKLDSCIQLSLLLFSNTSFWRAASFFHWIANIRKRLCMTLNKLNWSQMTSNFPQLTLWMVVLGFHAVRFEDGREKDWWYTRLHELLSILDITNSAEAKEVVEQFFYYDDVYGWIWRMIWPEAGQTRDEYRLPCLLRDHAIAIGESVEEE